MNARQLWMGVQILLAAVLLVVGFFAPLFTLTKFFIFDNTVSLYSVLVELWREGYVSLFALIGIFSVLFPLIKLVFIVYVQFISLGAQTRQRRFLYWLEWFGKWSMLDVFVVAIMVVAIKLGSVANVTIHYGVYVFAAAVLLMMLIAHQMGRRRLS